jgi:outer membrane protein TolC
MTVGAMAQHLVQVDPASSAAVPLGALVQEVEQNNPTIAASIHAWQASRNGPAQASARPDTQVTVQEVSVGSPRPLAGFSNSAFSYIGVGLSQELPYPGKRALRGDVAQHDADSLHAQSNAVAREVVETLKLAYIRLAYLQQTLPILDRDDQVLTQMQQIAESRYRVGQGNQQDVLKAQLQHTKILQDIAMHHQEAGTLQAQLKELLNRPQESPDIVTEPLTPRPLPYSADELLARVHDQNADVHTRSVMVSRESAQVALAHKDFKPDFNLQYLYQHTSSQFPDYYMATVGISLPNRSRSRAALAEAEEDQERATLDLQAALQHGLAEVKQQYVIIQTSNEQLTIYREGLLPQAEATFQAALAAYQSNRQDFESLLSSFLDVLNLNLAYVRELADHEAALARVERLTGVVLP